MQQNLQLQAAGERLIQAREQVNISRAGLFPTISADTGASRQAGPINALPGGGTVYQTNFDLGVSAAWQLDLFGEIRNQTAADRASYLASVANRDALAQSLIVQLMQTRIGLATLSKQKELIEQTIASREKTREIVERRYELGADGVSALDVRLARENLASVQSQLPSIESSIKENTYALDLLLGLMPNAEDQDTDCSFIELAPPPERLNIPPPAGLLDTRPDLRSNELLLTAANRGIDVAVAQLYPSVSIGGGYGFQAEDLGDLISADSIAWNLLANITQPLFEGGRLRANVRLQESRARELAADYAQSILTAVQEVENALQREENARKQLTQLEKTEMEANEAYKLAESRYQRGILNLTELLDIERRLLSQRQQILDAQQAIWNARLALHLALGGAWFDETPSPVQPTPAATTETDETQSETIEEVVEAPVTEVIETTEPTQPPTFAPRQVLPKTFITTRVAFRIKLTYKR